MDESEKQKRIEGRETVGDAMDKSEQSQPTAQQPEDEEPHPLGQDAPEIIHDAALIGRRRLRRPLIRAR
ncbi:MAG: hypothetical protein R2849_04145 [Thermomicrobiales bacterium]